MAWGFVLGEIKTKSVMRFDEKDEWAEVHEIIIGSQPSEKAKRCMKSKCPSWRGKAAVRPRRQGRWCLAFIGAKRKPLTGETGGSGAGFSQEGHANQVARS